MFGAEHGADEMSSFILAASCSWGFAFALLRRAHVRVESLQLILPGRVCAILDIVGLILLGAFVAVIGWYTTSVLALSIDMGALADMLDVPLWIPQAFWVAGFLVSVVLAVLLLIRSVIAFLAGDLAALQAMIGSRSAIDEAAQETSRVGRFSGEIVLSLVLLLGLMALTIPVVAVLGIIGLTLDQTYSMMPLVRGLGDVAWKANTEFILVAIPLYILLGQLLLHSGIAERMYNALS